MPRAEQILSRWTLPEVVHPTGYRKFVICVPDERFYIAAFQGLLLELTYSKNWQRDEDHTAAEVTRVWQAALATMECEVLPQFRQPDICVLEVSLDGGETWTQIFDATTCVINGVNEGILDALDDGTLAPGGQSGPGTPPTEAHCETFIVQLDGNGYYKLPISVHDGWTIQITNAEGAAYLGLEYLWRCPDGHYFSLGDCGGTQPEDGDYPMPGEPVGRLIVDVGGIFYDAYNTTITVPEDTGEVDVVFQINDDVLGDNGGSFRFKVEVCNTGVFWATPGTNRGELVSQTEVSPGVWQAHFRTKLRVEADGTIIDIALAALPQCWILDAITAAAPDYVETTLCNESTTGSLPSVGATEWKASFIFYSGSTEHDVYLTAHRP